MDLKDFAIGWFDFVVVVLLLVGITRGRKRGLSQELLDVLKWLTVVLVAGYFYEPIGSFLSASTVFSLLFCYLVAYALLALTVILFYRLLRRSVGEKLIGSDAFGSGEYYLGMAGGFFRYFAVLVVILALVNARYYSPEEIRQHVRAQEDSLGAIFFPPLGTVQAAIMKDSMTGRLATEYLSSVLIRSTSPEEKGLGSEDNLVKARQREVDRVLAK
jgi:uncharacterized membrane protein required for colicin V production